MTDLKDLRQAIDDVDSRIAGLLGERANLARKVGAIKAEKGLQIYSPERELEILARMKELLKDSGFDQDVAEKVFRLILGASRALVGELSVAFAGGAGSLAHAALQNHFGVSVLESAELDASTVVERVTAGDVTFGFLHLESSQSGLNSDTLRSLFESDVHIVAEVLVRPRLNLIGSGTVSDIRTIVGDLSAFDAAKAWLAVNVPEAKLTIAPHRPGPGPEAGVSAGVAVLSWQAAAQGSPEAVLARDIQDSSQRIERFIIIAAQPAQLKGQAKTACLCRGTERAGALVEMLSGFAVNGVSLTKIESRASVHPPGEYLFYIEFQGSEAEGRVQTALEELKAHATRVRVLGSFLPAELV